MPNEQVATVFHTARITLEVNLEVCITTCDSPRVLAARVSDALRQGNGIPMGEPLPFCLTSDWDHASGSRLDLSELLACSSSEARKVLTISQYAINHINFSPSVENGMVITDEHGNVILQGLP